MSIYGAGVVGALAQESVGLVDFGFGAVDAGVAAVHIRADVDQVFGLLVGGEDFAQAVGGGALFRAR